MALKIIILIVLIIFLIINIDKFLDDNKKRKLEKYNKEFEDNLDNNISHNFNNLNHDNNNHTYKNISSLPSSTLSITEEHNLKKYYKPKIYITTLNELKFYNVLLEIAKEMDLILFAQVSLYNIVSMRENLDYRTRERYFKRIASKSIDFVLVDKTNCRIKLCIELDDSTHKQKKRRERDDFINELFSELNINLLRYPVYNVYYKDTLKRNIEENIKDKYYSKS